VRGDPGGADHQSRSGGCRVSLGARPARVPPLMRIRRRGVHGRQLSLRGLPGQSCSAAQAACYPSVAVQGDTNGRPPRWEASGADGRNPAPGTADVLAGLRPPMAVMCSTSAMRPQRADLSRPLNKQSCCATGLSRHRRAVDRHSACHLGMWSGPTIPKTTSDQRLRWSEPVWSPPPESNRRPHPYHVSPAPAMRPWIFAGRCYP
jgi:hypothetical protein